jgi:hypothetical protein
VNLNPTELAWAAGFFDGEGSTLIAPFSKKRPDLLQFNLRVSQSSDTGTPEVLTRFQKAVGGLGTIYGPYSTRKEKRKPEYKYVVCKFEHTQAVIAMLWNHLGRVKKDQAKAALLAYQKYMQEQELLKAA